MNPLKFTVFFLSLAFIYTWTANKAEIAQWLFYWLLL